MIEMYHFHSTMRADLLLPTFSAEASLILFVPKPQLAAS
jgi:hypothetical protein